MKKVIIAISALVLVLGLVACGTSDDKVIEDSITMMKKFIDDAKAVIAQYEDVKTADDLNAANEAAGKLSTDMAASQGDLAEKIEKLDPQKLAANSDFLTTSLELADVTMKLGEASEAAAAALAKGDED